MYENAWTLTTGTPKETVPSSAKFSETKELLLKSLVRDGCIFNTARIYLVDNEKHIFSLYQNKQYSIQEITTLCIGHMIKLYGRKKVFGAPVLTTQPQTES